MPVSTAALIVAAGRGLRAGAGAPKQYRLIAGRPVLCHALAPFLADPALGPILVVTGEGDGERYTDALRHLDTAARARLSLSVTGGASRQESVRNGLRGLAAMGFTGHVLVHDAARPFISAELVARAVAACQGHVAAIPVLAATDTIKRIDAAGTIAQTLPRAELVTVQTPQVFEFSTLLAAHEAALAAALDGFTDDSAIMEWAGHAVTTFAGDPMNLKMTHPADFDAAEARLGGHLSTRVGTGYDVHAFAEGDHVWIGGVKIAHGQGVSAHSDGDVGLHALTDAILGALADGDIGSHFPPSDPQWRGASSDRFLAFAVEKVAGRGGRIDHLDLTLVCEAPKIGPHREAIRERVAAIAGIGVDRVGVKATTSERLGFTGRREGLAALATATLRLPEGS